MASDLIVSVSGIRGIVGQGLTAQKALAFALALGTNVEGKPVVLSHDGRPSGRMLGHAVIAGLIESGCAVHTLGVAPTPTCGLAVRHLNAAGGIQITASHNPAEWNGLKLFGSNGAVLSAAEGVRLKQIFDNGNFRTLPWNRQGNLTDCSQALIWHTDRVLELVNGPAICRRGFSIFVDANGGAGGPLSKQLLDALGCRVTLQGGNADGSFAHTPEPLAENLQDILPLVPRAGAAVGFVLDPDADRLALIDETGRYIGEELTLALAVTFRLGQEKGPVVINMSTSRTVEDIARHFGVACHRSAVGEANVAEKMREVKAVIGGEGNGGVIDPRVGFVRDPFIGTGMILNLLADSGKTLSALVAELPAYAIVKTKVSLAPERLPAVMAALEKRWPSVGVNRLDGLRLDWEDRWVHLRPSNTEPVVRIIAEAPKVEDAQRLC
ncbi:MAG TPA: phosphoglucosamine mutase, partial [Gemmataceae bacterium]|nr:phosphoglucosamine mutase [Gemmataceae bacterium]